MSYGSNKLDGEQKTAIVIITILLSFFYVLITLPSANVGVYMHNGTHEWAVIDSNGVVLENENGYDIKTTKGYHCIMMERSNGEDNHIKSFLNSEWEPAKALYLELKQLEIDNPNIDSSDTPNFALFLLLIGGLIVGIASTFALGYFLPESYLKISTKFFGGKSK